MTTTKPVWPTCPHCKKAKLTETVNTYAGDVLQRVVACERCSFVFDFDAGENWREKVSPMFKQVGYWKKENEKEYDADPRTHLNQEDFE